MSQKARRSVLAASGATLASALAGCGGNSSGSSGKTYQVGYGDYQTTVSASNFPSKLYVYAVQSGWSNWPALMKGFKKKYGVKLNDDQRSSGEALSDLRSHSQNPTHSAYNGGYTYGIFAMNDGLMKGYKPVNWDKVPKNSRQATAT